MADISSIKLNDTTYNIKDEIARKQGMFMSKTLVNDDVVIITENKDLNTPEFTIPGKYVCNSAAIGRTLTNVPDNQTLFQLLVYNPHNDDTGVLGTNNYRYRTRLLIAFSGQIYTQLCHCEGNTTILYEDWKKKVENDTLTTELDKKVNKSGDTMTGMLNMAGLGSTSAPIQMLNANDRTIGALFQFHDSGRVCLAQTTPDLSTAYSKGERYLLPTPTDHNAVVYYNILTSKAPVTTAQGGTGGTDSGWQSYTNSNVFTGTIFYRKVGVFFMIQAQAINLKSTVSAGSYVTLMNVPSAYRPSKEVSPMCFMNTGGVDVRVAPMRLSWNGDLILYANKNDAIASSYNLYFSGFGLI